MTGYETAQRRVNQRSDETDVQYQIDGTSVYVLYPEAKTEGRKKHRSTHKKGRTSGSTVMRPAFVLFLTAMIALAVSACIVYLELKETITVQLSENEKLESKLTKLRSENDALLENISNSVDWNHIKEVAIYELHMKYAAEDQIVWYNADDSDYITQYQSVP